MAPVEVRTPRCANGGCASPRVSLYLIQGLPEPRYLCAECRWGLRALYVIEPTAPERREVERRRVQERRSA